MVRKNRGEISRAVHAQIKRLGLNSLPDWHLTGSRQVDPPSYTGDVAYVRKWRVVDQTAKTGNGFTAKSLTAVLGVSGFQQMLVSRIDIWGSDEGGFIAEAFVNPNVAVSGKKFVDYGVTGSRRSHISIQLNPKDNAYRLVGSEILFLKINPLDIKGDPIDMDLVIDFHLSLRSTPFKQHSVASPGIPVLDNVIPRRINEIESQIIPSKADDIQTVYRILGALAGDVDKVNESGGGPQSSLRKKSTSFFGTKKTSRD